MAVSTATPRQASGALASATAHPITLPASVTTARAALVVFTVDSAPVVSHTGAAWTKIGDASATATGSALFYKRAGVTLTSLTVNLSFAEEGTYVVLAFDGASATEDASGTSGAGTGADPDPPTHTPAGGSREYLWVTAYCREAASSASAAPSGYSNLTTATGGASGAGTQTAERLATGASENPGPWTATAEDHTVWTISIPPAPAGGPVTLDGSSASASSASGSLARARPLAGAAGAASSASGSLGRERPLAGTAGAAAGASGSAAVARALGGAAGAVSAMSGSLAVLGTGQLQGAAGAAAGASGTVAVARPLAGASGAASAMSGALLVSGSGAGQFGGLMGGVSGLSGSLAVARPLDGAVAAVSGHDAALNTVSPPPPPEDPYPPRAFGWRPVRPSVLPYSRTS